MANQYNQEIYNTQLYNARALPLDGIGELERADGSIVVDKWISPLYRRFFPRHFYEILGYERFMKLYRYYLEYLEQGKRPFWVLSHIPELASIDTTLTEGLDKMREQFAPDFRFEDFPDIDARKFMSNAKRFYARKGTDQSFEFLFQMLGREVEIFKPIDDTLFIGEHSVIGDQKLIDSFYYTPFTYDVITDLPYAEWNEFIRRLNHPIGTQMFGTFLVLLANQLLLFPSINTNFPNVTESLVNVTNSIPTTGGFTLEVSGDISDFPDPDDPDSLDRLIIHIGNEDMIYTEKGDQSFLIDGRGQNRTRTESAIDVSQFFVDVDNNQLVYASRVDHYTGKVVQFTTNGTLPTPLESGRDYYVSLVESRARIEGDVTPTDTSITVEDASGFPPIGKLFVCGEIMGYSDLTDNTFTVTRGQDGTTAIAHVDEDTVFLWTRTVRVSETLTDAINGVCIPITDEGVGQHTASGPGVDVTLFTGFAVIRPQALIVRELIAYTSYDNVNRNLFTEDLIHIDYDNQVGSSAGSTIINLNGATDNPFSLGERVTFSGSMSYLTADVTSTTTTIPVQNTGIFVSAGFARLGDEMIQYTGKTGSSLTGVTRGVSGTTARSHVTGSIIRPRMFTDMNGDELDGVYFVRRGPGALQFQLVDLDENNNVTNVYTIQDDASGVIFVNLYDIDRSTRYTSLTTVVTQSGGATATVVAASGRDITLNVSAGTFTDTDTVFDDGANSGTVNGDIFHTLGEYQLWQCDFDGLTFEGLETGGTAFARELNVRFPQIREEQQRTINARYYVPTLWMDVSEMTQWQPDTTTPLSGWSFGTPGHVANNSAGTEVGIVRGYIDDNKPVIETEENLGKFAVDAIEIVASVGSSLITGDFTGLSFDPDLARFCVDIAGGLYLVTSLVNSTTLQLSTPVAITGLSNGDSYIQTVEFYSTIVASDGIEASRHCEISANDGVSIDTPVNIIRVDLTADVAASANWTPTTDSVFSAAM
jgi:hypothetical protein